MVSEAIELHDQAPMRPVRVNLASGHRDVEGRRRKVRVLAELGETTLELRPYRKRFAHSGEDRPQRCEAVTPWTAPTNVLDGTVVQEPQALRLLERSLELTRGHHLGEVKERSRDRRNRDSLAKGAILISQVVHAMQRNPCTAPSRSTRDRNVHAGARCRPEAPERCGTAMAEHSPWSAG